MNTAPFHPYTVICTRHTCCAPALRDENMVLAASWCKRALLRRKYVSGGLLDLPFNIQIEHFSSDW